MDEPFFIDVVVNGHTHSFATTLVSSGYTHKFQVLINGLEVIFEPDEERNFRAIINDAASASVKAGDLELIAAVGAVIQSTAGTI
jgi:hypothetical protein